MPRHKLETAKRRARELVKVVIKSRLNQTRAAKVLGVSPQAVQKRMHTPLVEDAFREYLDSDDLRVIVGYLKESDGGNKVQVFVGSDLISQIDAIEKGKVKSRVND